MTSKSRSANRSPQALVNRCLALMVSGNTDALLELRGELADAAKSNDISDSQFLARVLSSSAHLVAFEKDTAARSLQPYVGESEGSLWVDDDRLRELESHLSPTVLGLFRCEIGNWLHRRWQPERGAEVANRGIELLHDSGGLGATDNLGKLLLVCLARAWHARLTWQIRRKSAESLPAESTERESSRVLALRLLVELKHELALLHERFPSEPQGIRLVTSIVLDLLADLRSLNGEYLEAVRDIYEAQTLLLPPMLPKTRAATGNEESAMHISDRTRLAHVVYTAGKVMAAQASRLDYLPPLLLFQRSEGIYPVSHPLKFRASNRAARCLIHGGRLTEALSTIEAAEAELNAATTISKEDFEYSTQELRLSRLYILERRAPSGPSAVHDLLSESKAFFDARVRLPFRLQLKATLHRGLAEVRYGNAEDGRRHLMDALSLSAKGGSIGSRAAILLALCEFTKKSDSDIPEDHMHWQEATVLVRDLDSPFLREWYSNLAKHVVQPVVVSIPPTVSLKHAVRKAQQAYLEQQIVRAGYNITEVARRLGMSRTSIHRIAKDLGVKVKPDRP